jgi:choline transport protein
MSSTIVIGLGQGGTPVIIYGLIGTSLINVFIAATLAELSAAWPTAGGQYVWSSILASPKWRRSISFTVGWATIFEWVTTTASVIMISADVIAGLATTFHPTFELQRWHVFMIFLAINTISTANNLFVLSRLPSIGTMFLIFSTLIYVSIMITCPAAAETHQSNE